MDDFAQRYDQWQVRRLTGRDGTRPEQIFRLKTTAG
jgi:hypothetical protein